MPSKFDHDWFTGAFVGDTLGGGGGGGGGVCVCVYVSGAAVSLYPELISCSCGFAMSGWKRNIIPVRPSF